MFAVEAKRNKNFTQGPFKLVAQIHGIIQITWWVEKNGGGGWIAIRTKQMYQMGKLVYRNMNRNGV